MIGLLIFIIPLVVIFESSLREISIFTNISLLFALFNFLYWFKSYKIVFIGATISAILIDIFLHNHIGETLFAFYCPLFILTVCDNLLKIESKISRIIFSILGTIFSIFISGLLFGLLFWNGGIKIALLVKETIISSLFVFSISILFGSLLLKTEKKRYRM
jgi:hypothetical protein